jgi:hypothetical protein
MTEAEWLACADPGPMLRSLFPLVKPGVAGSLAGSEERFRRFAVACCRRLERLLGPDELRALDLLDRFADLGEHADLRAARAARRDGEWALRGALPDRADAPTLNRYRTRELANRIVRTCTEGRPTRAAMAHGEASVAAAKARGLDAEPPLSDQEWYDLGPDPAERAVQSDLLRDVFGNPFRPGRWDPSWRTETTTSLARRIYDAREFSAMPILADALEDAGCTSADVLGHCRGPGLHVRGCWVVGLVLGKP